MARLKRPKSYDLQRLLTSAARKIWFWSPMRKEAVRKATRANGYVICAECEDILAKGQYAVDHIEPVVNVKLGFEGFDKMYEALFCPATNLQVLCKPCHLVKTRRENSARRKHKK